MKFFQGDRCNATLGGGRSILLSYRDIYEISLILRGFSRFVQGDDLYFRGKIHQKNGHFANGFLPLESNLLKNVPLPRRQKNTEIATPLEPNFRFQKIIWPVINIFLGGERSILLSYGEIYNGYIICSEGIFVKQMLVGTAGSICILYKKYRQLT